MNAPERRLPIRILVVEATETVAQACLDTLKKVESLHPLWVKTEVAAFEQLQVWHPQILIVGDDLNGACGLALCEKIRQRFTLPLILVTSWPDITHQIRCLNSGADDCLCYPIEPPLLLARILCLLRRAYRYSVPPQSQAPNGAPQFQGNGTPRAHSFNQWPQCESCGYMGPREKFETKSMGRILHQCPACKEGSRIVHPVG